MPITYLISVAGKQNLDSDLTALAGQSGTNTFPVRTSDGVISEVPYVSGTFTPTVTLLGGSGNTVPVYGGNFGYYTRIGQFCYTDITLAGDGGAEGAGTGIVNIALPITSSSSLLSSGGYVFSGVAANGATSYLLGVSIGPSATNLQLGYLTSVSASTGFTGADQSNTDRQIRLQFFYRV